VYISSRTAKACEDTAARLTKEGPGECIALPADLANYEECERVVKELEKREEGQNFMWVMFTGVDVQSSMYWSTTLVRHGVNRSTSTRIKRGPSS
jgi:hypothetical protein